MRFKEVERILLAYGWKLKNVKGSHMIATALKKEKFIMRLVYGACFYPLDSKSGYTVTVPDLPGCVTEGKDLVNAIEMAVDAASGWILDELESGGDVPHLTPLNELKPDPEFRNAFVTAIVLDMDSYTEKYGNKAVRKNVTIPNWLNSRAEKAGVNFSQVLKEALEEKLKVS